MLPVQFRPSIPKRVSVTSFSTSTHLARSQRLTCKLQTTPVRFSHEKKHWRQDHTVDKKHDAKVIQEHEKQHKEELKAKEKDTVVEFSIVPVGVETQSLAEYVGITAREIKKSGLTHEVHPMGAIIEGPMELCFETMQAAARACLTHAPRVILSIKADIRPGADNRLHAKNTKINQIMQNVQEADDKYVTKKLHH